MTMANNFTLKRNAFGRLEYTSAQGEVTEGVTPVRAYPVSAPNEGVSLVSPDGHELAWIERLDSAPAELRQLLEEELRVREFMPEILALRGVSSFATPSTWHVLTDRGETQLVLKGEEDIRRLGGGVLLVQDSHGVQFLIRSLPNMDRATRRLLDRFL